MATSSRNVSNLMATPSELERIGQALSEPDFRQLLVQYAQEVSDPAHQAVHEREVVASERARGYAVHFLHPKPGFVIKSTNLRNDEKIFINICTEPVMERAESVPSDDASGLRWSIPYSLSNGPRKDLDRGGRPCTVYDLIVHPDTLALSHSHARMKQLVTDTALEAIEKAYTVKLEHQDVRFPKMKFKGTFQPTLIRRPLKEGRQEPHYEVKYRHTVKDMPSPGRRSRGRRIEDPCRPTHLVVEVELPEFEHMVGVELDVTTSNLVLETGEPAAYFLNIPLTYAVDEEQGEAKFDKSTKKLTVTLPVRPSQMEVERLVSTDSGIEVDAGYNACTEDDEAESLEPTPSRSLRSLPNYTCNIYEDVLVFTLAVKNVEEETLVKTVLSDQPFGFNLDFAPHQEGSSPSGGPCFGFGCTLVFEQDPSSPILNIMDAVEVEVWDNNVIVKVSIPRNSSCHHYKIGLCEDDTTTFDLPQLKAFRKRREQLLNTSPTHQSTRRSRTYSESLDDTFEGFSLAETDLLIDEAKERHNSGDSQDSLLEDSRFSITPSSLQLPLGSESFSTFSDKGREVRSILKRAVKRCFSESQTDFMSWHSESSCSSEESNFNEQQELQGESGTSKKSVRFNEVVQRQIFRPHSSILGQKHKNQKKSEQKKRRAIRRASEGDVSPDQLKGDMDNDQGSEKDNGERNDYEEDHHDSGVASSVDEVESGVHATRRGKNDCRKAQSKGTKKTAQTGANDLIFELDF